MKLSTRALNGTSLPGVRVCVCVPCPAPSHASLALAAPALPGRRPALRQTADAGPAPGSGPPRGPAPGALGGRAADRRPLAAPAPALARLDKSGRYRWGSPRDLPADLSSRLLLTYPKSPIALEIWLSPIRRRACAYPRLHKLVHGRSHQTVTGRASELPPVPVSGPVAAAVRDPSGVLRRCDDAPRARRPVQTTAGDGDGR